jgi:putative oxidoreductase
LRHGPSARIQPDPRFIGWKEAPTDPIDAGLLLIRVVVGLTFAAHGAQKAFGWWGGPGWDRWRGAMSAMGFRPASLFAVLSIGAELVGGLCLALGLLTPLAAAVLAAQSVVMIVKVHAPRGFWNRREGVEFPLALAAAAGAIELTGPGGASLDAAAGFELSAAVRVGLLLVGIAGGLLAVALAQAVDGSAPSR